MRKLSIKSIVAIGIGAALFFVLGRFVMIPSPVPNTNISIQYGVAAFLAVIFGPVVGLLSAFIGHVLIDLSLGYGVWWSWVIASGVFGLLAGLLTKGTQLDKGVFNTKEVVRFILSVLISHVVSWLLVAPVLDILMFKEPVNKVFVQGATASLINFVTTAIVGTILCIIYAKAIPQEGSLKKD